MDHPEKCSFVTNLQRGISDPALLRLRTDRGVCTCCGWRGGAIVKAKHHDPVCYVCFSLYVLPLFSAEGAQAQIAQHPENTQLGDLLRRRYDVTQMDDAQLKMSVLRHEGLHKEVLVRELRRRTTAMEA